MVAAQAGLDASTVSAAIIGLLLLASVWWDGAFDLRNWAPLTVFALVLLLAQAVTGRLRLPTGGALVAATAAIWLLAGFTMLSAAWSESADLAWAEAARGIFYATLWTLGISTVEAGRSRSRLIAGLTIGVGVIALATLVVVFVDATDAFRAGRLESPIGYRNGTAALFACGVWPLIGYAARRGGLTGLRGLALATAVVLLGLAFLTQSRGTVIGLVAAGAVSIAIGPDRLRRVWLALAAIVPLAIVSRQLLRPYDAFDGGAGAASAGDIHAAALALVLVGAAVFVVAIFAFVFDNGLRSEQFQRLAHLTGIVALIVVACGAGAVALTKVGDPVTYAEKKVDEFKDLEGEGSGGATRFGTVGGQRSDLWRVALDEFDDHPVAGGGAGSYWFAYYRDRHSDRNLDNTHSLPFALLAETGLVGILIAFAWLVALGVALARRATEVDDRERVWLAGAAALGATVLAQSAVDWFWLIPGLFGLGIFSLGLAAAPTGAGEATPIRWPGRLVPAGVLGLAALSVAVLFLGDFYMRKARVEALHSPRAELSAARTAADLDPVSVTPLYLEAAALESSGHRAQAERALNEALGLEPRNFVTLGLLGDFEERGGKTQVARRYYRRAHALNPLDSGIRKLSEGVE